jgi:hypothetical protein
VPPRFDMKAARVVEGTYVSQQGKERAALIPNHLGAYRRREPSSTGRLPHGAMIKTLQCVVRDNTSQGYIQVTLNRGPINTTDPIVPMQTIASAVLLLQGRLPRQPAPAGDPRRKLRGCSVEYVE